jgi:hypothetical protein
MPPKIQSDEHESSTRHTRIDDDERSHLIVGAMRTTAWRVAHIVAPGNVPH